MTRIPVHILTGFLGAGKTTFLNDLLKDETFSKTAVIVNEFGETGLDHLFIRGREDAVIELSNGCLCCTIRGELADTLAVLPDEGIDRVIVETTGLADPVPVLQAIIADPRISPRFEAASLVTLVDALNAPVQLDEHMEAVRQVALSDLLLVTKLDMAPEEDRAARRHAIETRLRALNAAAPILERGALDLSPALLDPLRLRAAALLPSAQHDDHHHHDHGSHQHDVSRHGEHIRSVVLRSDRPMPRRALDAFCELLASAHSAHLLRLKGLVSIEGEQGPLIVHGIHGVFHEPEQRGEWPDADHSTRIVVIIRDMDPDFVARLFAGFANLPRIDTPDRAAMLDNPLAIGGFSS